MTPIPDKATIRAYLARLGVEPEPPSAEALTRLHRAHVERIPYETLWIQLREAWSIDPLESMARIAHQGRGGYCYHLNGAFSELLSALGYRVTRHTGAVHGPDGPSESEMANHLVLTVHGLPTTECPYGTWYVDAGLGDALHEPIQLRPITLEQGPFHYTLASTPGAIGDWHFTHDPAAGSFTGMVWRTIPVEMDAFTERHVSLSTSPESRFVQVLTAQRRDATGVDVLRGRTLRRIGANPAQTTLGTRDELMEVLTDVFGVDVRPFDIAAIESVWNRVCQSHEAWLASQAASLNRPPGG
jgi:arylamine N-acetyltransferase